MSIEQMREALCGVYSSDTWHKRVSKMHDNQVIAIYYKFMNEGKFDRKPVYHSVDRALRERECAENTNDADMNEQLTIYDFM